MGSTGRCSNLGLGNGRTYDHLRELCPDRRIYVCERQVAAHPDCIPPAELLLIGDMRATLQAARERLEGRVALAHLDAASGEIAASLALAQELAALVVPLLRPDAVLVSEPELSAAALAPLAPPEGVAAGRYHLYRRVKSRSTP